MSTGSEMGSTVLRVKRRVQMSFCVVVMGVSSLLPSESIEEENTYPKVLNGRLLEIIRKIMDSLTRGELDEQAWIEGHYFIAIHSAKEAHDKAIKYLEKEVLDLKGTLPPNDGGDYRTIADDSFEKLPPAIKGGAGA